MKQTIDNFVIQEGIPTSGDYHKHRLWKRRHEHGIPPASEAEAEFRMIDKIVIPTSALPEFDKPRGGKKK